MSFKCATNSFGFLLVVSVVFADTNKVQEVADHKMKATLGAEKVLKAGKPEVMDSKSPKNSFAVVFEDDGNTGYLYGLDTARKDNPILDALHIYNVASVVDQDKPSKFTVAWSGDGLKAVLLINDYPHAVFDFEGKRGYCRTGFPAPGKGWTTNSHEWTDSALNFFR